MDTKKRAKAPKPKTAAAAEPSPEMVEVLRTCDKNLRSYGGFQWPESGPVTAPDWSPTRECGKGLHGLMEGQGDWGHFDWSIEARAMIVLTEKSKVIDLSGKVKFQTGIVKRLLSLAEGICYFITGERINKQVAEIRAEAEKGNDPKTAASGSYSKLAASGSYSKLAASGDSSKLAASGDSSKLAASGDSSQLAASGDSSQLAASGDSSKLAASGDSSKLAASGEDSVAIAAGNDSIAKAGKGGAIAIAWHDGTRPRIAVGYVGEDGIEADAWYRVTGGKLTKA